MFTYLRYSLAAVYFACCVGCLALWWRSHRITDSLYVYIPSVYADSFYTISSGGSVQVTRYPGGSRTQPWFDSKTYVVDRGVSSQFAVMRRSWVLFPHWYAALIFALAGVGVLRFRRQFSIRSAMICVSVVAALLGMAVVL